MYNYLSLSLSLSRAPSLPLPLSLSLSLSLSHSITNIDLKNSIRQSLLCSELRSILDVACRYESYIQQLEITPSFKLFLDQL